MTVVRAKGVFSVNLIRRGALVLCSALVFMGAVACGEPEPEPVPTPEAEPSPEPSPTPEPRIHVVQQGETLYGIARQVGTTVEALVAANNIADPDVIHPGQELIIPETQP